MTREKIVRIGGASGFWGDSRVAAPQLVASGKADYLAFDYLAETTMAILAGARLKNPQLGYATDFVEVAMRSVLPDLAARRIKVVSNAGGIHPARMRAGARGHDRRRRAGAHRRGRRWRRRRRADRRSRRPRRARCCSAASRCRRAC